MRVSRWGNSLAVRFPRDGGGGAALKEGDAVDVHVEGARSFAMAKAPGPDDFLARICKLLGRLPRDFTYDRLDAQAR